MNEENNNGIYIAPDNGVNEDGEVVEATAAVGDAPTETITPTAPSECENTAVAPATDAPSGGESIDDMLHPNDLSKQKRLIADHLCEMAHGNPTLREKIVAAVKDGYGIDKCYDYIASQAREEAVDGCAMIEDDVVYGWAVHYYEDEWIAEKERDAKEEAERAVREKEAAERAAEWKAEQAKREAERKEEEAKAEEEKLAAMTTEERLAYEREKARKEAEEAERKAAAERAAAEAAKKREEREEKRRAKEETKKRAEEAAKAQMTFF